MITFVRNSNPFSMDFNSNENNFRFDSIVSTFVWLINEINSNDVCCKEFRSFWSISIPLRLRIIIHNDKPIDKKLTTMINRKRRRIFSFREWSFFNFEFVISIRQDFLLHIRKQSNKQIRMNTRMNMHVLLKIYVDKINDTSNSNY